MEHWFQQTPSSLINVCYFKDSTRYQRHGKELSILAICRSPEVWLIKAGFGGTAFLPATADGKSLLHLPSILLGWWPLWHLLLIVKARPRRRHVEIHKASYSLHLNLHSPLLSTHHRSKPALGPSCYTKPWVSVACPHSQNPSCCNPACPYYLMKFNEMAWKPLWSSALKQTNLYLCPKMTWTCRCSSHSLGMHAPRAPLLLLFLSWCLEYVGCPENWAFFLNQGSLYGRIHPNSVSCNEVSPCCIWSNSKIKGYWQLYQCGSVWIYLCQNVSKSLNIHSHKMELFSRIIFLFPHLWFFFIPVIRIKGMVHAIHVLQV